MHRAAQGPTVSIEPLHHLVAHPVGGCQIGWRHHSVLARAIGRLALVARPFPRATVGQVVGLVEVLEAEALVGPSHDTAMTVSLPTYRRRAWPGPGVLS